MRPRSWRRVATALALVASAAAAGDLADGLRLAAEGRCAEALPLLHLSEGVEAARARGLCLLQTADAAGAARELAPLEANDASLTVDLAVARFHSDERALAERGLLLAEARGDSRAEIPLYLGLIALDRADVAQAAGRFERARELAPLQVEPAASYYAGLARNRAGDSAAGRAALERVVAGWPGSVWATEATRALAAEAAPPSAWFASLRAGIEHDSNAVLRGEGVELPDEIASQADQRFVWRGVIGRATPISEAMQLGGALAFSGWHHRDLGSFDTLYPQVTLWADRRLGERFSLRAVGSYSYAWVNEHAFLSSPAFALELSRDAGERGTTRAFAEFVVDDYRFESTDPEPLRSQRDRDGFGLRVGLDHRISVPALDTTFVAALAYRGFSADGSEYSFDSPEFELGWESFLPAKLVFAGSAHYAFRSYRHDSTYSPVPSERTEHEWRSELSLRRALLRQLAIETRWRYQRNRSTVDVFDYARHVVGLYATWTLNP